MTQPLVSCIMPTANREKYVPFAIKYFLEQDYPNKELIIIDDGKYPIQYLVPDHPCIYYYYTEEPVGSIGIKRNYACEKTNGEIIIHWDDDDWHAPDWISAEVYFLQTSKADMVGMQHIYYYSAIKNIKYMVTRTFTDGSNPMNWVHGATLAYWKSFWKDHPFQDLKMAEDDEFIQNTGAKLFIHDYRDGFICILHPHNTVMRNFEDPKHKTNRN